MSAALPFFAIAGTLLSAFGSVQEGLAANQNAKFQAAIARRNADINEANAQRASFRSQVEQQQQDFEAAQVIGDTISRQAGSGLSLGGRSFGLKRKSLQELARKDALTIRQAGDVEAFNFRVEASNLRAESKALKLQGKNAKTAGFISAGSTLIGSLGPTGSIGSVIAG